MNVRWREFLLLVTLVAAAATPAFAQTVPPAVGPAATGKQSAVSIPDFSGIWRHPYLTGGFEPPLSGPGPVRNRARRRDGVSSEYQLIGDYTNPILKPQAAEEVKKHGEIGDSVGHYEGDTLVVDTVGIKTDRPAAMIDMYGTPYTQGLHVVERYRLIDYEAAKEAQERAGKENVRIPGWAPDPNYRGKGLQLQFTVEDEGVFTMPWSATVTYLRASIEWPEIVCAENTHEYYAGKDTAVPTSDKPDF
jgi:hypothetical protein